MNEKKVLIIDDDQTFAAVMKDGLESMGFKTAVAFDALQGVMQAHQASPDVILLDFNMPAGGGANAYERLRSSNATGKIPVVFTTAAPVDEVRGQIRAGPKTFFLKKPVSLNQVKAVLAQVLGVPADAAAAAAPPPVPAPAPASVSSAPVPSVAGSLPSEAPREEPPSSKPVIPPFRKFNSSAPAEVVDPQPSAPEGQAGGLPPIEPAPIVEPPSPEMPRLRLEPVPEPQIQAPAFQPQAERVAPAVPRPAAGGHAHEFEVRVIYGDTDKMGVIYYANYFKYFEQGRAELMRSLGVRYRDLELERKLYLPVVEARCMYRGPARYDDLLLVRTRLTKLGSASVFFTYEIIDRSGADRVVAEGFTRHALVDERWKPVSIPGDLRALLSGYVNPAPSA